MKMYFKKIDLSVNLKLFEIFEADISNAEI